MKLEINIEKKYFFVLLGAILVLGILGVAYAFGTNNPSDFGHTPGEINPGIFGGSSTDSWIFRGKVGIGGAPGDNKLDVRGQVVSSTGFCIGADCKSSWSQIGTVDVYTITNIACSNIGLLTTSSTCLTRNCPAINLYRYCDNSCPSGGAAAPQSCTNTLLGRLVPQ